MKKFSFLAFFSLAIFAANTNYAQKQQRVLDPQNMREGETVEYCITHKKQAALEQNSAYLAGQSIVEAETNEIAKEFIFFSLQWSANNTK